SSSMMLSLAPMKAVRLPIAPQNSRQHPGLKFLFSSLGLRRNNLVGVLGAKLRIGRTNLLQCLAEGSKIVFRSFRGRPCEGKEAALNHRRNDQIATERRRDGQLRTWATAADGQCLFRLKREGWPVRSWQKMKNMSRRIKIIHVQ